MTADLSALLDSLEAVAAAATPGPWVTPRMRGDIVTSIWGADVQNVLTTHDVGPLTATDAALIVAAVNALPTLIAELRRHQAAVQAVRELAERLADEARSNDESARASRLGSAHGARHTGLRDASRDAADRIRAAVAALDPKEQADE